MTAVHMSRRDYEPDIARYLLPGEPVRLAVHQHPIVIAKKVAVAVAALLLLLYVAVTSVGRSGEHAVTLLLIVFVVLAIRAILAYDWWRRQWFVVTDSRVMLVSSFIGHSASTIGKSRITHLSYHRTVPGHIFGYGHFVFQSAGKDQPLYRMKFVSDDPWIYQVMVSFLGGLPPPPSPGGGSLKPPRRAEAGLPSGEREPTVPLRLARRMRERVSRKEAPEDTPAMGIGARHRPSEDDDDDPGRPDGHWHAGDDALDPHADWQD